MCSVKNKEQVARWGTPWQSLRRAPSMNTRRDPGYQGGSSLSKNMLVSNLLGTLTLRDIMMDVQPEAHKQKSRTVENGTKESLRWLTR